jgi:hypothetical protein
MMEAARTSETLVNVYQTTRLYNPEDSHRRTHRRENLIALMMEAARTSETSVNSYQTTRCYNPEDSNLHRLRVFENRVLGRVFVAERDEVTRGWRKLHNEQLHRLYSSPDNIRVMKLRSIRWAGHVARMGGMRNAYKILLESLLGRPRRRWWDNIKMNLREMGLEVWIGFIALQIGTSGGPL